jgi:hypothetical protein
MITKFLIPSPPGGGEARVRGSASESLPLTPTLSPLGRGSKTILLTLSW